jgi:hypothetical protein
LAEKILFQLKVTLRDSHPPIWRRVQVPKELTLERLHDVLQIVMGWTDSHLHQFKLGDRYYGTPDPDAPFEVISEKRVRLDKVLPGPKARMVYEYDFGDSWQHDVVLEKEVPATPGQLYPLVLAGERECPPEDVGGIGGFYHFLDIITNPKHPEHPEMMQWVGGRFDPEAFDLQQINRALHVGRG